MSGGALAPLGLGGKATITHSFCLGDITERDAAAEAIAEAGISLVTYGGGNTLAICVRFSRGDV
jgi:hypothetical protein